MKEFYGKAEYEVLAASQSPGWVVEIPKPDGNGENWIAIVVGWKVYEEPHDGVEFLPIVVGHETGAPINLYAYIKQNCPGGEQETDWWVRERTPRYGIGGDLIGYY